MRLSSGRTRHGARVSWEEPALRNPRDPAEGHGCSRELSEINPGGIRHGPAWDEAVCVGLEIFEAIGLLRRRVSLAVAMGPPRRSRIKLIQRKAV